MVDSIDLAAIQGPVFPTQVESLRSCKYPVLLSISFEESVCADLRSSLALVHNPSRPWLHGHYPTSWLLRRDLTSPWVFATNLAATPCPSVKEPWRRWAPPRGDLPSSDISRVYMPWPKTLVVPVVLLTADAAFAAVDLLGHHGKTCLTGLDPFTHDALRPAHSLSTLRRLPRDSPRKTRYREGLRGSQHMALPASSLFPRTGLTPAG